MTKFKTMSICLVVSGAFLTLPRMASGEPKVHQENGISFITGGVGHDEEEALQAMGSRFNLKVTMAQPTGHFLSDARINIRDSQGKTVLDTIADGPQLYAQLPPGNYTVVCNLNSRSATQTTQIKGDHQQQLTFTMPAE